MHGDFRRAPRFPSILLPSISQTIRSSAVIIPLQTAVGVHRRQSSSRRILMFPSFAAIQPLSKTSLPMSTISFRNSAIDLDIRQNPIVAMVASNLKIRGPRSPEPYGLGTTCQQPLYRVTILLLTRSAHPSGDFSPDRVPRPSPSSGGRSGSFLHFSEEPGARSHGVGAAAAPAAPAAVQGLPRGQVKPTIGETCFARPCSHSHHSAVGPGRTAWRPRRRGRERSPRQQKTSARCRVVLTPGRGLDPLRRPASAIHREELGTLAGAELARALNGGLRRSRQHGGIVTAQCGAEGFHQPLRRVVPYLDSWRSASALVGCGRRVDCCCGSSACLPISPSLGRWNSSLVSPATHHLEKSAVLVPPLGGLIVGGDGAHTVRSVSAGMAFPEAWRRSFHGRHPAADRGVKPLSSAISIGSAARSALKDRSS